MREGSCIVETRTECNSKEINNGNKSELLEIKIMVPFSVSQRDPKRDNKVNKIFLETKQSAVNRTITR